MTGSPVLATILAHFENHSFMLLASRKRSPIHLIVILAKYWEALYNSPLVSYNFLSLSCLWIYFLAPMKVTPYTEVITVCLIILRVTCSFRLCATSSIFESYSFSISDITSLRIAVYTSPGFSESARLTYLAPLSSLPRAA